MAIENILRNCTAFVDGVGMHGLVVTLTPPKLTEKNEEYRGGGMDTPIEIALGTEKLESSFDLGTIDPRVWALWGLKPGTVRAITFKGYAVGESGTDSAIEIYQRGRIKEIDEGDWEPGKVTKTKVGLALQYYKRTQDGAVITEIDALAGLRTVGGVDQTLAQRRALGMA